MQLFSQVVQPKQTALIVSTYNQPQHLNRCLKALQHQSVQGFELVVADDGSGAETARVIGAHKAFFGQRLKHVWQPDQGFRKTRILNRAILATSANYLVFTDGDCLAAPDFVATHLAAARSGHYVKGAMIRLSGPLSSKISSENIASGEVFRASWLLRNGGYLDRRYLKLLMGARGKALFNAVRVKLFWLGANSACFRSDALAVNGFDLRFGYGYEDGDFGNRLCNYGIVPRSVRYSANLLHLDHGRPYTNPEETARNRALMVPRGCGQPWRAAQGFEELEVEHLDACA
jgi:glycosyltransferase involved in cell wall biosynthesis